MHINSINGFSVMPSLSVRKNLNVRNVTPEQPEGEVQQTQDSVSFKGRMVSKVVKVPLEKAKFVANSLSTSTSGHRAKYLSENFTKDIVKLISIGVALYAAKEAGTQDEKPVVLIGGDTRRATSESLPEIERTLINHNVNVINIKDPVPTPLLAMAAKEQNVDLGVLMTASHNPWDDGGYNLVTSAGAIAPANVTEKVAEQMINVAKMGTTIEDINSDAVTVEYDPFRMYVKALDNSGLIDWNKIKESGLTVYYDGLQGTGTYTVPRLLAEKGVKFENIVSQGQEGPNPTDENLTLLKKHLANDDQSALKIGLANDGDADRFGVVDEKGNFINANDVILLTAYHLVKNKGLTGSIGRSQATSMKLDRLAELYGVDVFETPVGFKYIAEEIERLRENGKDILVAGEESGGLTVNGHIPEKDGIIAISLMMDLVATEGKPISEILANVNKELGISFSINNFGKTFKDSEGNPDTTRMNAFMDKVEKLYNDAMNGKTDFGVNHKIDADKTAELRAKMEAQREGGDGYKFVLTDGTTVLFRKSGTEPKVKCYIEATGSSDEAAKSNSDSLAKEMASWM